MAADSRVRVADRFDGPLVDAPYFGRYARVMTPWRLVLADVDGEPAAVTEYLVDGVWAARGIVRVEVRDGRIVAISDYEHCPWVVPAADVLLRQAVDPA